MQSKQHVVLMLLETCQWHEDSGTATVLQVVREL